MATASKAAHEATCVAKADITATTLLLALPAPVAPTDENGNTLEPVGFPACVGEHRADEGADEDEGDDEDGDLLSRYSTGAALDTRGSKGWLFDHARKGIGGVVKSEGLELCCQLCIAISRAFRCHDRCGEKRRSAVGKAPSAPLLRIRGPTTTVDLDATPRSTDMDEDAVVVAVTFSGAVDS